MAYVNLSWHLLNVAVEVDKMSAYSHGLTCGKLTMLVGLAYTDHP